MPMEEEKHRIEKNMIMVTGFLYLMALLATAIFLYRPKASKKKTLAPSPPALPVVGHFHLLKEPLHRTLQSLALRYGPIFRLRLGRKEFLIVSSPHAAEQCLAQNDAVLADRPRLLIGQHLGYDSTTVVWASHGELWRNLRRVAIPSLQKTTAIRVEEARFVARKLLLLAGKVDVNEMAFLFTKNVVMRRVAGKRWPTAGPPDDLLAPIGLLTVCDFFPVLRWLGYGGIEKSLRGVSLNRDRFIQCLIDDARNGKAETASSDTETMVEGLLSLQNQDPKYYTDKILKGLIVIMLTAGTTTTAHTIEWVMSLLLAHPTALNKARLEIDHHVGVDRLVEDSDLSSLTFLRCIFNESLRLFPTAPLLLPHCSSADTCIDGYDVPKGTTLLVNAWAMHRDPSVWEDPLEFKPERFEGKEVSAFGFRFIPFGTGKRSCPGMNLATRSIMIALATWIQCFDWDTVDGVVIDMEEAASGITISKSQHLLAVCKPRPCMVNVLSHL